MNFVFKRDGSNDTQPVVQILLLFSTVVELVFKYRAFVSPIVGINCSQFELHCAVLNFNYAPHISLQDIEVVLQS